MLNKRSFISFDKVFPQLKGVKVGDRNDVIRLAKKVAAALEKEGATLAKEKQNSTFRGFFSPSA